MEMHQKDLTWWLDLACHTSTGCQEPWMAVTAFILDILPDLLLFSVFIPALPEIFNVCFLRLSIFASVRVLFNRFILERTLFFGKNKSDLNNFWSGNLAEREDGGQDVQRPRPGQEPTGSCPSHPDVRETLSQEQGDGTNGSTPKDAGDPCPHKVCTTTARDHQSKHLQPDFLKNSLVHFSRNSTAKADLFH